MDKLTEAIKEQYRRRLSALRNRDTDLTTLHANMEGKVSPDIYWTLREAIYGAYQPIVDDTTRVLQVLEELRDSGREGE